MIEDVGHDDAGLLLSLFLSPALSLTHARAHAHTGTLSFSGPSLAPKQRQAQRQLIGGFGLSEEEQALLRRRLLCGCC